MRGLGRVVCVIFVSLLLAGCSAGGGNVNPGAQVPTGERETAGEAESREKREESAQGEDSLPASSEKPAETSLIDAGGMTLETRILTPGGYVRTAAEEGSLAAFLRAYSLKEDGSPVLLYNGRKKGNQSAHQAVFTLPIEAEDLQQCADSVMRVYAEYFYLSGQQERISFHFTNGFPAEYAKWRDGGRILVEGNDASWVQSASYDDSYECFQKYLRMVFTYAGTLSMEAESSELALSELQVGDVFLKGGSPGHVVMVVDLCENKEGKKAFLLGQGYMPAQEFHVLKNPLHEDDPWYYEEEVVYPFETPEYVFAEGSLRRLCYLDE